MAAGHSPANRAKDKSHEPAILAIIDVSVALAVLQSRLYDSLNTRMDCIEADLASIKERLSRIEDWIAGGFEEELPPPA